ncbi:MetQ/NlpA family ABC transporter substrate-binding protein [Streptomyces sp. CNQ085]|nr:MetQ/NlpA family ABC transporter substrate-binding protein [Streptomyces sp. CNQ085]
MITTTGLTKVYRSRGRDVTALDGVGLHVREGEVFGVVGRSGAGKSSLIRCVNLLERPTSGTVVVDGQDLTALAGRGRRAGAELRRARSRIGMVFQHFNLLSSRTVQSNVELPLEILGVPGRERALKLLDDHGLIELKESAGQDATLADIADDKGLEFKELEAAALPRSLDDVDAAVINGNYAVEAGLEPVEDALALEEAEGNPYVNLLVVKEGGEDDPRVRKLADLLASEEVADFIEEEYRGSVVAASDAS